MVWGLRAVCFSDRWISTLLRLLSDYNNIGLLHKDIIVDCRAYIVVSVISISVLFKCMIMLLIFTGKALILERIKNTKSKSNMIIISRTYYNLTKATIQAKWKEAKSIAFLFRIYSYDNHVRLEIKKKVPNQIQWSLN